ncbi:MAG: putative Ig domain-containing protein, partial [Aureliella sp.]
MVTVVATDVAGGAGLQSYQLDVLSVNHGPIFVSTPPTKVYAGATLKYDLAARDDDLDPLKYEIVSGAPSGMSLDALGRLRWSTTATDLGDYSIQIRVSDPRGGISTQSIALQVIVDDVAPKVTVLPTPGGWPWQGPIVVFVSAVDNVGISQLELKVNDRVVALDANHVARLYADDWGFGTLNMVATARDVAGNVGFGSGVSFYRNPDIDYEANPAVPTAIVTSPAVDESVVGMVRIEGTAAGPDFKEYRLLYARADKLDFVEFAHATTEVQAGLLGTWDTTLLDNDAYIIRLEVTDLIGSTNVVDVSVGLSGALKLGNFHLSFEDMTIPVAGIPITVVRTYDTLRADRQGDFGYGWQLEYRDTDLRTSLPKSGQEDIGIYTPFKQGTKVYLTLPGGERQGFTFTPEYRVLPGFGQGNNLTIAFPRFTADRGVSSTLTAGSGSLLVNEFGEMYIAGGIPWNPASADIGGGYTLTTRDGTQFKIDGDTGLLNSLRDQNGNSLTFSDSGISSPVGQSVRFERDAQGRIVSILDPADQSIGFTYDSAGNLVAVIDRRGNTTRFTYLTDPNHYLHEVIDPLGRMGVRSEYDADGRLSKSYDFKGKAIEFVLDPGSLVQTVYDESGNPELGTVLRVLQALG